MYGRPSTSPKSNVRSTFGCVIRRASVISLFRRSSCSASDERAGLEHLQRDDVAELEIVRLVDDAHAAGAELGQDAIAAAEDAADVQRHRERAGGAWASAAATGGAAIAGHDRLADECARRRLRARSASRPSAAIGQRIERSCRCGACRDADALRRQVRLDLVAGAAREQQSGPGRLGQQAIELQHRRAEHAGCAAWRPVADLHPGRHRRDQRGCGSPMPSARSRSRNADHACSAASGAPVPENVSANRGPSSTCTLPPAARAASSTMRTTLSKRLNACSAVGARRRRRTGEIRGRARRRAPRAPVRAAVAPASASGVARTASAPGSGRKRDRLPT